VGEVRSFLPPFSFTTAASAERCSYLAAGSW
jgi:hypothetical protein